MSHRLAGARSTLGMVRAVARTGVLRPVRPDRLVRMARGASRWGATVATPVAVAAARHPERPAVIDARGTLDWATLEARTNAIADGLLRLGVDADATVGILCRNHRGFVEALVASAKIGADVVLLNTGFPGPQLGEVATREGVTVLVHDASFHDAVAGAALATSIPRVVAWADGPDDAVPGELTFDALAAEGATEPPPRPPAPGEVTILSSGTTGTPKGAHRSIEKEASREGLGSQLGVLTRVPLRAGAVTLVSAPLFHTWGLSGLVSAATITSPVVLRGRFDAEDALAAIAAHRVDTLVAVPVMLQRILDLPHSTRAAYDTSTLRVVFLSGSALPGRLAVRWMDTFGDNLYNLYGSTEVAAVAVADAADLRSSPDTAGPVLPGVSVRLVDAAGAPVRQGETGRILVRSGMVFEGYTGGGTKEVVDGHMSTGDLGRFDEVGRLHIEGREDDMIISGGENVVPREVEEVLLASPDVADVAVVGVPDSDFGQRLVAYVAPEHGATPDPDAIRSWVRERLANYKVPREVRFVERLPRNPTGKVLRRVLVEGSADAPVEE